MGQNQPRATLKTAPKLSTFRTNTEPNAEIVREPVVIDRDEYKKRKQAKKQQEQHKKNTAKEDRMQTTHTPLDAYFNFQNGLQIDKQNKTYDYVPQKDRILQQKIRLMSQNTSSKPASASSSMRSSIDMVQPKLLAVTEQRKGQKISVNTQQNISYYYSQESNSVNHNNSGPTMAYMPQYYAQASHTQARQSQNANYYYGTQNNVYSNEYMLSQQNKYQLASIDFNLDYEKKLQAVSRAMKSKNWVDVIDPTIPAKLVDRKAGGFEYRKKESSSTADPDSEAPTAQHTSHRTYRNPNNYGF